MGRFEEGQEVWVKALIYRTSGLEDGVSLVEVKIKNALPDNVFSAVVDNTNLIADPTKLTTTAKGETARAVYLNAAAELHKEARFQVERKLRAFSPLNNDDPIERLLMIERIFRERADSAIGIPVTQ